MRLTSYLAYHGIDDIIWQQQWQCFLKDNLLVSLADECTDITTIEELLVFCWWLEYRESVEHFFEILPLKKADAKSICSSLIKWLKQRNI